MDCLLEEGIPVLHCSGETKLPEVSVAGVLLVGPVVSSSPSGSLML